MPITLFLGNQDLGQENMQ